MAIPANVALQLPPALGGVKTNPNLAVRHWPASLPGSSVSETRPAAGGASDPAGRTAVKTHKLLAMISQDTQVEDSAS